MRSTPFKVHKRQVTGSVPKKVNGIRLPIQRPRKKPRRSFDISDLYEDIFEGFSSSGTEATSARQQDVLRPSSSHTFESKGELSIPPEHLLIHRVDCQKGINHNHHSGSTYYLDNPKLIAGDNKASALRGTTLITDIEEHLEENSHISIVVYRTYNCENYHQQINDRFEHLQLTANGLHVVSNLRPYLYVLPVDGPDAVCESEGLRILSGELKHGLQLLQRLNSRMTLTATLSWNIKAPYLELYHFRGFMKKSLPELPEASQQHLAVLLDYVEQAFGQEYEDADTMFGKGLVTPRHMSKLFGPNEPVVATTGNQPMGYLTNQLPQGDGSNLNLRCESWSFDGQFRRNSTLLGVGWPYTDSLLIKITDLAVYPLKYDTYGFEERLRSRGMTLWKCRKRNYISYNVPAQASGVQTTTPRYMVDMNTYRQMHTDDEDLAPQRDDLGAEAMNDEDPPDDVFPLLLPATVPGYGFHDKKWIDLDIESISDIQWNTRAFERLVLQENKKELIEALISVHVETASSTDVIEGKGNGLIMLLHGGPGTGKTLTAESIAELTGKPLYRVTCGDIGTNPDDVEKYLETVLLVGTIWGCVVLLDEADVFLEERSQTDLQRNALVSVFLRALEYYEGILILTSNRVGTFDEAFKSRVQLALHYPDLDEAGRLKIWRNFIASLPPDTAKVDELLGKVETLAKSKLNGRQIRNTVKTAMQLAYFRQQQQLDYTHFERVIEVAEDFEKYIERVHGHSDGEWARDQNFRA